MYILGSELTGVEYITSKKDLFKKLSEHGFSAEVIYDMIEYPILHSEFNLRSVGGTDEVLEVLELMKQFLETKSLNNEAKHVGRIIEFLENIKISDTSIEEEDGLLVLSGELHYFDWNRAFNEHGEVLKNAMFQMYPSPNTPYVYIPIIPVELVPSDEFTKFVREVSEDED